MAKDLISLDLYKSKRNKELPIMIQEDETELYTMNLTAEFNQLLKPKKKDQLIKVNR